MKLKTNALTEKDKMIISNLQIGAKEVKEHMEGHLELPNAKELVF